MKITFFLNTPAHVHLHKNTIAELSKRGHEITILARDYGDTLTLLRELDLQHFRYSKTPHSKYLKLLVLPRDILTAFRYLRNNKPDVIVDVGAYGAYTSFLLRRPCVLFNDSEPTTVQFTLVKPFVRTIITPSSFSLNLGRKQLRVNSYKELAYLHPKSHSPNPEIKDVLGVHDGEEYSLLRFNAFDALHDLGIRGFSIDAKRRLVAELEKYGKVFISSEAKLPADLEKLTLRTPKRRIHDVVAFAKLVVADTQTIITEAAMLGTPAVRYNTFVGQRDMGNFVELEERYNLLFNFTDEDAAVQKAIDIMKTTGIKEEWKDKARIMLEEKIDLTEFIVNYLESLMTASSRGNRTNS